MEKIFYNGSFPFSETGHDALYIRNGQIIESGYLNTLKTAHPDSVMMDLERCFLLPCGVPSDDMTPAHMLVFDRDPFSKKATNEVNILQIYKNGEPMINS